MQKILNVLRRFSFAEGLLFLGSSALILLSAAWFDRGHMLTPLSCIVGVASLLFNAKGHPFGQLLMVAFSCFYGLISYSYAYYGEMITYLGMTAPMAVFSFIAWLRHPHNGSHAQVQVGRLTCGSAAVLLALTTVVTVIFHLILKSLGTANLAPSTLSVATSFLAAALTFLRSALFPLAYAANDIVLIVLWLMASADHPAYLCVVVCFFAFLINDLYGFFCWRAMQKQQNP